MLFVMPISTSVILRLDIPLGMKLFILCLFVILYFFIILCFCLTSLAQVRGLKKRKEAIDEEAKLALEEYESSLKQLEDKRVEEKEKSGSTSGRRVFGARKKQIEESSNQNQVDNYYGSSDSEDDVKSKQGIDAGEDKSNNFQKDVKIDPDLLREESEIGHDNLFKVIDFLVC